MCYADPTIVRNIYIIISNQTVSLKKMQNWIIQHGKDEYVSYKSAFSSRESLNRVVKPQQEENCYEKGEK